MSFARKNVSKLRQFLTFRTALYLCFIIFGHTLLAHAQIALSPDENTMVVDDIPTEIIAYGKNVIVRKHAKGVLAIGGDITVEGVVDGDVATIGGSIYQREGAFIGGDVLIFGGKYKPDSVVPLRTEGKETVMFGVYEEELREMTQNPSQIFAPSLSLTFLAWRVLSILFWFIVTLALATIAPGAVSRAIARFKLSTLKVTALGFSGLVLTTVAVIFSLKFLPSDLSAALGLMVFSLMMLSYVFGRVALQVSVGQLLQRKFLTEGKRSETIAILIGVVVWTVVLSIPYIWSFAVLALFSAGIGLVLTARSKGPWTTA
ncbi:MAG: hypothetical protein ABI791_09440 [Acidobacteriota bacterium]